MKLKSFQYWWRPLIRALRNFMYALRWYHLIKRKMYWWVTSTIINGQLLKIQCQLFFKDCPTTIFQRLLLIEIHKDSLIIEGWILDISILHRMHLILNFFLILELFSCVKKFLHVTEILSCDRNVLPLTGMFFMWHECFP